MVDVESDPIRSLPRDPRATRMAPLLERLDRELDERGLPRVPAWFSVDWFSPAGVLGLAMPFYLASDELLRVERRRFGASEDGAPAACMRFLRHEAGHAIDHAFRLSRRRVLRERFGPRSTPYRATYRADPWSEDFVRNLPRWYAQSHPAEDFAETFAVWLDPRSGWKKRSRGKAREKLDVLDTVLAELAGTRPPVRTLERTWIVHQYDGPIRVLFDRRERSFADEAAAPFESTLSRTFEPQGRGAVVWLTAQRAALETEVCSEYGISRDSFGMLFDLLMRRARLLRLGPLRRSQPSGQEDARRALARALSSSLGALRRGSWLLSR